MITKTLTQPETQLGTEFIELLGAHYRYTRIVFVSAFTALRTILRLRESMLTAAQAGTVVRIVIGIDLGGTSRDVLEELLRWESCEVFIFHNPMPRATFHPKIYLFERESDSTLFIGSNNLTDGGLYTNYEAASRFTFQFPTDANEYERLLQPLTPFLNPEGPTVCRLDALLIENLSARGELTTEAEARQNRRTQTRKVLLDGASLPPSPFTPMATPMPPLLPRNIRDTVASPPSGEEPPGEIVTPGELPYPPRVLVWRKKLPKTDALQVNPGSHHVGGVRLTQAGFESVPGQKIDQTTYFRNLFNDFDWEPERDRYSDQEHTFVPIRIVIRGQDYGIRNFEISHKPSGEAGQANYTTILRWGRDFINIIEHANLTDTIFSLYETVSSATPFLIDITDA